VPFGWSWAAAVAPYNQLAAEGPRKHLLPAALVGESELYWGTASIADRQCNAQQVIRGSHNADRNCRQDHQDAAFGWHFFRHRCGIRNSKVSNSRTNGRYQLKVTFYLLALVDFIFHLPRFANYSSICLINPICMLSNIHYGEFHLSCMKSSADK
jgi:hypothetical protein